MFLFVFRYTCPFVEKFSIDIETYYKPDTGTQNNVFNLSSAEKRQRDIGNDVTFIVVLIMYRHCWTLSRLINCVYKDIWGNLS